MHELLFQSCCHNWCIIFYVCIQGSAHVCPKHYIIIVANIAVTIYTDKTTKEEPALQLAVCVQVCKHKSVHIIGCDVCLAIP